MEDAGVYDLDEDTVLVQTVDFITPVLDDPYAFGQAAAANSLSDIYAMGARPVTALNLVGFPARLLGPGAEGSSPGAGAAPGEPAGQRAGLARGQGDALLASILRGGLAKATEAGAAIVGGHSIDDPEPKYGLAATGLARRSDLLLQSAGRPGDVLYLTKPIGGGLLATALKRGGVGPDGLSAAELAELTDVMTTLNAFGRDAALSAGARAATDVTGFGLLGHLSNLVLASGVGAELSAACVPVLRGAARLVGGAAARGTAGGGVAGAAGGTKAFPGGTRRNLEFVAGRLRLAFERGVGEPLQLLLADPMTSGGLLVAVPAERAELFEASIRSALRAMAGVSGNAGSRRGAGAAGRDYWCAPIGTLTGQAGRITVNP